MPTAGGRLRLRSEGPFFPSSQKQVLVQEPAEVSTLAPDIPLRRGHGVQLPGPRTQLPAERNRRLLSGGLCRCEVFCPQGKQPPGLLGCLELRRELPAPALSRRLARLRLRYIALEPRGCLEGGLESCPQSPAPLALGLGSCAGQAEEPLCLLQAGGARDLEVFPEAASSSAQGRRATRQGIAPRQRPCAERLQRAPRLPQLCRHLLRPVPLRMSPIPRFLQIQLQGGDFAAHAPLPVNEPLLRPLKEGRSLAHIHRLAVRPRELALGCLLLQQAGAGGRLSQRIPLLPQADELPLRPLA
mmetsp:Transcript_28321/g.67329  ORF Transcript_28321/g.67329 Transcript_28321/m.67329 type:complete len:300 (+) Transcript_28321:166-1065(+)